MNYLENVDKEIIEYLNILESEFPEWLNDYINPLLKFYVHYLIFSKYLQ